MFKPHEFLERFDIGKTAKDEIAGVYAAPFRGIRFPHQGPTGK